MIQYIVLWNLLLKLVASVPAGHFVGEDESIGALIDGNSAHADLGGGTKALHAEASALGYGAAAGLGGSVGGKGPGAEGKLYAVAGRIGDSPTELKQQNPAAQSTFASSSAAASASASSSSSSGSNLGAQENFVHNRPPNGFFDDIFNIPISTLGAVNQYLNNRNKVAVQRTGSAASSASAHSSSVASQPGGTIPIAYQGHHKTGTNYNDIFNIPISVLNSVNRFLSGR